MKRLNPLEMAAPKEATPVVARATNDVVGECPICLQESRPAKMRILEANKIESWVCLDHRICLPTKDQ